MTHPTQEHWMPVCATRDIVPDTGVCALVEGRHVAVFRLGEDRFYAIDNVDPRCGASVLARGLVGSLVAVAAVQAEDPCQNRRWCRFCSEPRRVSARSSNRRSNAPWSALQW